jgi:hypothetical protein
MRIARAGVIEQAPDFEVQISSDGIADDHLCRVDLALNSPGGAVAE